MTKFRELALAVHHFLHDALGPERADACRNIECLVDLALNHTPEPEPGEIEREIRRSATGNDTPPTMKQCARWADYVAGLAEHLAECKKHCSTATAHLAIRANRIAELEGIIADSKELTAEIAGQLKQQRIRLEGNFEGNI